MIDKIILTRGIPGSGKSTWAKQFVAEDPEHRIRLNWDDMRNMMGPYWVPSREFVNKKMLQAALITIAYESDTIYTVVIDNMNLNPKGYSEYYHWLEHYNSNKPADKICKIEFKDFFTPVEECIRRDSLRSNPIGEKTIKDIWNKYKHFIQTTSVEQYVNNLIKPDPNKPYCVVIDMDSTMCFNTNKRPWYGPGAAEGMSHDIENFGVCEMVNSLSKNYPIIVATGRDTTQEEVTKNWLKTHNINPKEYYFRKSGDYRKGVIIKKEQITKILEKYNILIILEDSQPIVDMYREMGLTVLQPNKGL